MTTSEHDAAGRPARITRRHLDTGAHLYTSEVSYDEFNNLKTFKEQVGSDRAAYTTTFTHNIENRPTLLNFGSSRQVAYVYDGLGRISRRTVNAGGTGVATTYGYLSGGHGTNSTTPLVQTITQSGTTLTYAYDDAGNITSVSDGTKTISYEYDLLGQLTRVNDPYDTTAGTSGTTWKYAYDQGGNIQSKTAHAFTTGTVGSALKTDSFTYGDANWKDKLTAFNGMTITYDEIGNPTSDGTWNYTWYGRQMRAIHKGEFGEQGYDEITFEYNENGLRTKKTRMYYDDTTGDIGYKATNYTLHGKNIVHMSDGSNNLHFFYDAQNRPAVVTFNGTAYTYLYNLQGDVIGLLDNNGTKVVSYTYDAWGKPNSKTGTLASTLGTLQPFRYRGYVFDEETGLYYLHNRYYSCVWSRFISPDLVQNVLGSITPIMCNLYGYCANSPVNLCDSEGAWPWDAIVKGITAAVVVVAVVAACAITAGAAAVAIGATTSAALAVGTVTAGTGLLAGGAAIVNEAVTNPTGEWDYGQIAIDSFYGSAHGFVDAMTMGKGRPLLATCKIAIAGCWAASDSIHRGEPVDEVLYNASTSMMTASAIQGVLGKASSLSKSPKPSPLAPIYYGQKMLTSPLVRFGSGIWKYSKPYRDDIVNAVIN